MNQSIAESISPTPVKETLDSKVDKSVKTMVKVNKKKRKKVKKKKAETPNMKKYKKYSHVQHVLELPDTYVGSCEKEDNSIYVFVDGEEENSGSIQKKEISYVPALYKIYDEILVNAEDQSTRLLMEEKKNKSMYQVTHIKINIDKVEGRISVLNDGDGIDVVMMDEHGMYPAELIFANLLTSVNFNKDEAKVTGGKNGYGAKLANIFSKEFVIETVDRHRGLKYKQTFRNNMSEKEDPIITKYSGKPYTKISFVPDYQRFGMEKLEDGIYSLMKKRAYDVASWTDKRVSVYFNDYKIPCKTLEKYADLYLGNKVDYPRVYQKLNENWEVVATYNTDENFEQVSFVNGINTVRGGKHVDYVVEQLREGLVDWIKKKKKLSIKSIYVKNQIMVFVKATIVNPSFDGQTKETLTTPKSKFGTTCQLDSKFINNLANTGIIDKILSQAAYKGNKELKKTDGKKSMSVRGIPKLTDANKAGGRNSRDCVLILTEGDSAKTTAIAGLSEVGRDLYGVYPLRGKVLNVKDADVAKIARNKEITEIKKILGLKSGQDYDKNATSIWPLRYGKIMIMTDQDVDGSHIKGLLMNLFYTFWPSLLKIGFVTSLITPIIKVTKGKKVQSFYTLTDYENWKPNNNNGKGWKIKYYKGLGTSTTKEAKDYFRNLKQVEYTWSNKDSGESLDLAFNKKRADDRKGWLQTYDRSIILDSNDVAVSFEDFIEKDFKHFSNYDLYRSIPSLCDGFKPSQRKIMYSCFKRNLKNEIKVAQLAGYVSEHASYHHGEASLQGTIVGLAQQFVGSNNINLLKPNGQFGSRIQGGKDSASPRYIFTELTPITFKLFNSDDFALFNYLNDDGTTIEPEWYLPILPTILINGAQGIGTGYSTNIPSFNPLDIVKYLDSKIKKTTLPQLKPWFRGFTGSIEKFNEHSYITKGIFKKVNSTTVRITELPIGTWTEDYKIVLESLIIDKNKPHKNQIITSVEDNSTESTVDFTIKFNPITLMRLLKKPSKDGIGPFERKFKLTSTKYTNLRNMHLYNQHGQIKKYHSPEEIIDEFFEIRLQLYQTRKDYILNRLSKELNLIQFRAKFINEIVVDTLDLRKKKKVDIHALLKAKGYPELTTKMHDETSPVNYDYLIKMPLDTLTQEKIDELLKQRDVKQAEYNLLEGKSKEFMWNEELVEMTDLIKLFNKKNKMDKPKTLKKVHKKKKTTKVKAI